MRKYLFLIMVMSLFACNSNNEVEVGNKTTMKVDKVVHDAGEVMKGEMITAKFRVTNTGSFPLYIAQANASCSCTVTDKPDGPIAPGESADIVANVNTDLTGTGALNKSVRITANTTPAITQVRIIGNVIQK